MTFLKKIPQAHKKILTALLVWYATSLALVFFLVSKTLDDVTGRPAVYPGSFNTLPLLMPVILLGTIAVLYRHAICDADVPETSWKQASMALYASVPVILFSFFITHPGEAQFSELLRFLQAAPVIGGTVLSGVMRAALFLPSITLLFAFLPFKLIRTLALPLVLACVAMFLFLFANIVDALFYDITLPFTLTLSYWPLQFLRQDVSLDASERLLQVGSFKAFVGPTCAGFSLLLIFMGFYAIFWQKIGKRPGFSIAKAMVALPVGLVLLYLLNVLRISILMLVGAYAPDAAVTVFHGAAGTLILLGVSFLYLSVVHRWIVRKQ